MTARSAVLAPPPARSVPAEALAWVAVPVGVALLMARIWLLRNGGTAAPGMLATFGALAALSLASPQTQARAPLGTPPPSPPPASTPRGTALPRWAALAAGFGAVGIAAVASTLAGPALPARATIGALGFVVVGAVAEEAFFRRLVYGRLLRWGGGGAVAVLGSAVAFGVLHLPLHGTASFPVDLGAGVVLSWQRWASGSWGVPAATHAFANVLAVIR
ncbi:MAG: type II CAAX prenyl endopeptidase Rce1 family protein [Actinomycetota bacterium]